MRRMQMLLRHLLVASSMVLVPTAATQAEVSIGIGIGLPGVDIGIDVPAYPRLVPVPGHPVYYDPRAGSNYFFYDGLYWVYQDDDWYASSWYNGPWRSVGPEHVPSYVLRVPVRYYRRPPAHFQGWRADAPPRWGAHWGRDWEQRRAGWDRWDRRNTPAPAPLPAYQRAYTQDRYPHAPEQQHAIRAAQYRYQPHERIVQQHYRRHDSAERPSGDAAPRGRGRDDRGRAADKGRHDNDDDRGKDRR